MQRISQKLSERGLLKNMSFILKNPSLNFNTVVNTTLLPSPMNYIGGKFKLMPQLLPLFPDAIDTFYDVFAGGGVVSVNTPANTVKSNDLNYFVIEILSLFKARELNSIVEEIEAIIAKYRLSKSNKEGFLALRDSYNQKPTPIKLYTLVCYSFNYQFRFNNNHEYNNPFGMHRSHFSSTLKKKLIYFITKLQSIDIRFSALDFQSFLESQTFQKNDFVYFDPPYLITTGNYNDGNRGFKDWSLKQEASLYECLLDLDKRQVKWALSNVLNHKGKSNLMLQDFAKSFNTHLLNHTYRNSSYNTARGSSEEVLITNY